MTGKTKNRLHRNGLTKAFMKTSAHVVRAIVLCFALGYKSFLLVLYVLIFTWPVNPTYVQLSEANSPRMDLLVRAWDRFNLLL